MKTILLYLVVSVLIFSNLTSQTWERFTTENSELPVNSIDNLVIDSNDNLWFHNDSSIYMFNQNEKIWSEFNEENSNLKKGFTHIEIGKDKSVYVSSSNIYKFEFNTKKFGVSESEINCISFVVDNKGKIYLSTLINVLAKDNSEWEVIFNGQENGPRYPTELIIDVENVLWFGTFGFPDGVYSYDGQNLNVYNNSNYKIPNFTTESIAFDSLNNIWFLSDENLKTYKFDILNDKWTIYDSTNSILNKGIYDFSKNIEIKDKVYITSTTFSGIKPRRLLSYDFNEWKEFNIDLALNLDTNKPIYLNALAIDSKNNVWIGTNEGLIKFNEAETTVATFEQSNIKLYPNPASDVLNIDLVDKQALSYTITDIEGRIIIQEHHHFSKQITIDTKSINSGAYFIKLKLSDNHFVQSKFVKE